jgi:hypothetical protein
MNDQPQVSVVVLNYNKPDLTLDCVRSIINKTKVVSYEVVVVDNASTIGNIDEVTSYSPVVRLIKSDINLGFAKGNNLGIQHCKGETILLLNNDTVLINDAVSLTYEKLRSSDKIGVVGAQLLYPDGEVQKSAQRLPEIRYLLIELFRLQKFLSRKKAGRLLLGSFFDHQEQVNCGWLWGTYFHLKREVLRALPGGQLADDFFMYNEDMQWGIEIHKAGYQLVYYPEAKIYHFEGKNKFKSSMVDANFATIMNRYYGHLYYWVYRILKKLILFTYVGRK